MNDRIHVSISCGVVMTSLLPTLGDSAVVVLLLCRGALGKGPVDLAAASNGGPPC